MKEEVILKKVRCNHCLYSWVTKSKMVLVSCPSCSRKIKGEPTQTEESGEASVK